MRTFISLLLSAGSLSALHIQIDYSLDDNNFFHTQERKDALESVAKFYGDLIQDNLLEIDGSKFAGSTWGPRIFHPATGKTKDLESLVIPEDTIIIYAGSRDLGFSATGNSVAGKGSGGGIGALSGRAPGFRDLVLARGQEGALLYLTPSLITDVGLWGGSISFDHDTVWNFSLKENQPGQEFLAVALHEMAHVLGIGNAQAWRNLLSNERFTGPAVVASHGSAPGADEGHFLDDLTSPLYGSFGAPHGVARPVRLLASEPLDDGNIFDVITDLDLAALVDIGWEIAIPTPPLTAAAEFVSWPSTSFYNYQITRSTDLETFSEVSGSITGDGTVQTWRNPSPDDIGAYYKFSSTPGPLLSIPIPIPTLANTPASIELQKAIPQPSDLPFVPIPPTVAPGCYCDHPAAH